MIFNGGHLGFFRIRYEGMTHNYKYKWFHSILDPENIGVDTRMLILCQLELELLFKLDFRGGYFKNPRWPP